MMMLSYVFSVSLIFCIMQKSLAYDLSKFPEPFTAHNRIMGFILSFAHDHVDPMMLIMNEYVSMCEGGWDPSVVIFTTVNWTDAMMRYTRQRTYCYRTGRSVNVTLSVHDRSVGTGLAIYHKYVLAKELDNYDFFVYHEDDIIFKYSHLVAYLKETKKIAEIDPEHGLHDNVIGFQRFRRILRGDIHTNYGEVDVFESELLEETPDFRPICYKDTPYLLVTGNMHQAIWAFTTIQLHILQKKCNFIDHKNPSREFMSSFLVFDKKPNFCGMNKLLPAERFQTFNIWHYYHQRHVSWSPSFIADENLRAGYAPYNPNPKSDLNAPPCWSAIVAANREEQQRHISADGA